ncbi:WhiB family transcriptional regulator [Nocardioides massiliensis]|uniref:WhiB family transcriptional regulator n=1 Tax=Nocardioides massiliensis TaxID=1325935 RepID=UPI0034CF7E23
MRTEASLAWVSLVAALEAQVGVGRPTPCQVDPEPFTSDELRERRDAARACAGCPLIEACEAFAVANGEVWHVWGGRDRASRAGRRAEVDR